MRETIPHSKEWGSKRWFLHYAFLACKKYHHKQLSFKPTLKTPCDIFKHKTY